MSKSTLLLEFNGPLQAYYCGHALKYRPTQSVPTKSAVAGLVGAAKGYKREEMNLNSDFDYLSKFNSCKMGVREDKPGTLLVDYQTVDIGKDDPVITERQYLENAKFVVGLENEDKEYLEDIMNALVSPAFAPALGRRNCVACTPIVINLVDQPLEEALKSCPLLENASKKGVYRMVLETEPNGIKGIVKDVPISFDPKQRLYGYRAVKQIYVEIKETGNEIDGLKGLENAK